MKFRVNRSIFKVNTDEYLLELPGQPTNLALETDKSPSVSVLIPARNEQSAMRESLELVLANNYPRMEILVLDDNSVDNTSDEIRQFVHKGVRFVRGEEPPEGWLGRNYAYERLANESTGDYLLFLSVDTKISPNTIDRLVYFMQSQKADMVSVLPTRADNYRWSVLLSTLRYFLELVRAKHVRPPAASAAWMIRRDVLVDELGGLKKYRQAIAPESKIARTLNVEDGHDLFEVVLPRYRFVIDEQIFGVNFEKRWSSQVQTQQRNYALEIFRSPMVILIGFIIFLVNIAPFGVIGMKLIIGQFDLVSLVFAIQLAISTLTYAAYASLVWTRGALLSIVLYPIIIMQEFLIFLTSIHRRFFGKLVWRGREIRFRDF